MANEANLENVALENRVENMKNTLKELMASFQSLQATLVTRAPLTTNPLFEGNVSVANLAITTSTLRKEPMSSCLPNPKDEDKAIKAKVQLMEETLKSMQGVQTNKPVGISSLCFFPNIQLSHKFKLPEFDKYNGTGCPYAHLTMYCRKMAPYANDEELMIHYFYDSLTGPADAWFSTLDKSKVKSWHDLTYNFMKQYEYNTSLAHNREDLQRIDKKSKESFKEFAQRWRGLAARFVVVGEQVEDGIKSGIIIDYQAMRSLLEQYQNGSSGAFSSKKPRRLYASGTNCPQQKVRQYFDKLPLSYTEVFQRLVVANLVTPAPMVPIKPPFPMWYNPQARCEYHSEGVGHDLENCLALRHRVQDLIEAKELQIALELELVGSNITKNPLPPHNVSTVNMIKKDFEEGQEVAAITLTNQVSSTHR
ncbi:hypothetical protein SLEP1_g8253 [Rubroshorea leprosula]|uniref:Retrotransposon gag domain-containing protein n=1 Tax=Rubroshorea leprosula TaxID=152421 RepID=A0AAV5I9E1_9ROSI|nr:hypothetical protein SLEP1_g8253 [Rubroshorea leprosula]